MCTLHKTLSGTPIMASYLKANIRVCHFQEKIKSLFQNFHKLWVCPQIFKKENYSNGLDVRGKVFYFPCFQIILKKTSENLHNLQIGSFYGILIFDLQRFASNCVVSAQAYLPIPGPGWRGLSS